MSSIHALLSRLPDELDYEKIIRDAYSMYRDYTTSSVAKYGRLRLKNRLVIHNSTTVFII